MKKASVEDKPYILEMLESSFRDVPGVNWVIGSGANRSTRLRRLLDLSIELTFHQGEIWLSDDGRAAMLLFRWHRRKPTLYSLWLHIRLALQVVGLNRVPEILARERYIRWQRPQEASYLYCWFIAVHPDRESMKSINDVKDGLFRISVEENLPIYMETTVSKAMLVYRRYGFELFHRWENTQKNVTVWFLRRDPAAVEVFQKQTPARQRFVPQPTLA